MVTLADQVSSGIWQVFCVDCVCLIGTFDYPTLTIAIERNRARGGIKCDKCRKTSCKRCGLQLGPDTDRLNDEGFCVLCVIQNKLDDTQQLLEIRAQEHTPLSS